MKSNMTTTQVMTEWKNHSDLFNRGANRVDMLKSARAMNDSKNKEVALLQLGIATPKQKRGIDARWKSINSVTERECRLHCQFDGLPNQ